MNTITQLSIFFLLTLLFTEECGSKRKETIVYDFLIPATITPLQDTFTVGDTILVKLEYNPDSLLELNKNEYLKVDSVDFKLSIFVYPTHDTINQSTTNEKHSYRVIKNGSIRTIKKNLRVQDFTAKFENQENKKVISFGLIPKYTGFHVFNLHIHSSHIQNYWEIINCQVITQKSKNNKNLFVANNAIHGIPLDKYNDSGYYSFWVQERFQ